jgi:hypothetical protein
MAKQETINYLKKIIGELEKTKEDIQVDLFAELIKTNQGQWAEHIPTGYKRIVIHIGYPKTDQSFHIQTLIKNQD